MQLVNNYDKDIVSQLFTNEMKLAENVLKDKNIELILILSPGKELMFEIIREIGSNHLQFRNGISNKIKPENYEHICRLKEQIVLKLS